MAENVTALKSFAEYVAPGEIGSLDELKRGNGAIVRRGLEKIAAYRDEAGALHLNSASCTHVGCHLHWNSFETCWDCPCHGSMFDVEGQPINAPAIGPLAKGERIKFGIARSLASAISGRHHCLSYRIFG